MSEMTPYHQIVELVARLRDGRSSGEDVEKILQMMDSDLQGWAQKLQEIAIPSDNVEGATQMLEESMQGLQFLADAVGLVRQYIANRDETVADGAVATARHGIEMLARLKNQTDENIDRILLDTQAKKEEVKLTFTDVSDE